MNTNDYLNFTRTTAQYPADRELEYLTLGLCGEAGEVANKVKKIIRDGAGTEGILSELGDCLYYITRLADALGTTLEGLMLENVVKLRDRKERGVIGGAGDNR